MAIVLSLFSDSEMGALSVAPVVSSSSVSAVPADAQGFQPRLKNLVHRAGIAEVLNPCVDCYLRGLCGDECGRRVGRGYL